MKIYLSSGFFTEETRAMVEKVAKTLREQRHEVYVPMEHTIPNAWGLSKVSWAQEVFNEDLRAIEASDKMVVLDFGANGDCGTAWEAGYAFAKGIPYEVWSFGKDMSIMVWGGCKFVEMNVCDYKLV